LKDEISNSTVVTYPHHQLTCFVETAVDNIRMAQLNESENFKIIEPLGSGLM